MTATLAFLALVLMPGAAWACATCVASAYGDRTFNWAFIGLILMPFAVALGIAAVLAARYYAAAHRDAHPDAARGAVGAAQLAPHEESSL